MSKVRLKLAPPWITYVNKVKALFGEDPDVNVVYDNENVELKLYVDNAEKASAISFLLPEAKQIGNILLRVTVIPANNESAELGKITVKQLFDYAFDRNPVYAYTQEVAGLFNNVLIYVVFKNRVVQFFNDNLDDIHGLISTLYQDIAEEIFEDSMLNGVFYNTDIEEKVGMIENWP